MRSISGMKPMSSMRSALVDDEDLDAGQKQPPALEMIEQAAGRCDQHVGAARDDLVLLVERNAADQTARG